MKATEGVIGFLASADVSYHRGYFAPGEIDESAVVVSAKRISDEDYAKLASGTHDYASMLVPDFDK